MATIGLIHIILFALEDFLIWFAGTKEISFWVVFGISMIVIYLYYNQLTMILKKLLNYIGLA